MPIPEINPTYLLTNILKFLGSSCLATSHEDLVVSRVFRRLPRRRVFDALQPAARILAFQGTHRRVRCRRPPLSADAQVRGVPQAQRRLGSDGMSLSYLY